MRLWPRNPGPSTRAKTLAARYVDGEMTGEERARFAARLARDHRLHDLVSEVESLRAWFRGGRGERLLPASPGFKASVLAAARRLPSREELLQQETVHDRESELVSCSRRIVLAAAVIFGVSTLFFMTARFRSGPTYLEARSNWLQHEMERLDEAIRAEAAGAESRGR